MLAEVELEEPALPDGVGSPPRTARLADEAPLWRIVLVADTATLLRGGTTARSGRAGLATRCTRPSVGSSVSSTSL